MDLHDKCSNQVGFETVKELLPQDVENVVHENLDNTSVVVRNENGTFASYVDGAAYTKKVYDKGYEQCAQDMSNMVSNNVCDNTSNNGTIKNAVIIVGTIAAYESAKFIYKHGKVIVKKIKNKIKDNKFKKNK